MSNIVIGTFGPPNQVQNLLKTSFKKLDDMYTENFFTLVIISNLIP